MWKNTSKWLIYFFSCLILVLLEMLLMVNVHAENLPNYSNDANGKYPTQILSESPKELRVRNHAGMTNGSTIDKKDGYFYFGENKENADYAIKKSAKELKNKGEYEVELKLKGNTKQNITPLDIVLVVDMSGSMNTDNKAGQIRNGVSSFLDKLEKSGLGEYVNVGLVGFSSPDEPVHQTTVELKTVKENKVKIETALNQHFSGHTFIQDGLRRGGEMLARNQDFDHNQMILLLTDGEPTHSYHVTQMEDYSDVISIYDFNEERYVDDEIHYAAETAPTLVDFAYDSNSALFKTNKGYTELSELTKKDYYNSLKEFEKVKLGSFGSPKYHYYLVDNVEVSNTWIATLGEAKKIEAQGILIKGIGIDIKKNEDYKYGQIQGRMQRLTTIDPETNRFDYRATPKPEYEEDPFRPGAIDHYSDYAQGEAIGLEYSETIESYLMEQTRDVLVQYNTVVGGKIIDPLGPQFDYVGQATSNRSDVTLEQTSRQLLVKDIDLSKGQELVVRYKARIRTEDKDIRPDYWYPLNGQTTFQPSADQETTVEFGVPSASLTKDDFMTLALKIEWDEFNPEMVQRPDEIDYKIIRNKGLQGWVEELGSLDKDNNWTQETNYIVTKNKTKRYLPKYDNQGQPITYEIVEELPIPGYDKGKIIKNKENNYTIINEQHFDGLTLQVDKVANFNLDKRLSGAVFSLSGGDLAGAIELSETEKTGIYTLDEQYRLMPNQIYHLKEEKAPDGYNPSGPWSFQVDKEGQVKKISENMINLSQKENKITLKIKNDFSKQLHLVAKKIQTEKNMEDGQLIRPQGSEFLVKSQDGSTEFNVSGNEDDITQPNAKVMLYPGAYTIEETKAPIGYKKESQPYSFFVSERGIFLDSSQQEIVNKTRPKKDGFYRWKDNPERLAFAKYNEVNPFTFVLNKRNKLTNRPIPNVTFAFSEEATFLKSKEFTTDEKGNVNVSNLKMNEPYYFKEVTVPEGYHKLKGVFKLMIQNDSTIKKAKMSGVITYDGPEKKQLKKAEVSLGEKENKVTTVITNRELIPLPNTGGTVKGWLLIIGNTVVVFVLTIRIIRSIRRKKNRTI